MTEENKDAGRNTIFGAVSVILTYLINLVLPKDVPAEVKGAILFLVLVGITYGITYLDSKIHRSESKMNGLLPF